jgi:hypothetical protein
MDNVTVYFLWAIGLFAGMLCLAEAGRKIGIRRMARDPKGALEGFGAIEGAIFGLLGLLIAFTFYGATARFDARRQLIIEETNAIGTAFLRLDLLPNEDKPALQNLFREYVDSRLETYRKLPDVEAAMAVLAKSQHLQGAIWTRAMDACRKAGSQSAAILLLPALNQMIDITTTRTMTSQIHPPLIIFVMLCVLALVSSLLAGYGMARGKKRSWFHVVGYALIMALTVYVTIDIEYPRLGLIRVDAFDQALADLRKSMG